MSPIARAAQPTNPEVIDIEFDVADLPDTRVEITATVEAELQRLLGQEEALPAGVVVAEDRRLLVVLRPGPIPGADDVLIRIEAQFEGATLSESVTETCLSCTNEQVAEKALPMLRPLLEEFPEPKPVVVVEEPVDDTSIEQEVPEAPTPTGPNKTLLLPGASLLGVGFVGFGAGIALIVVNERVVSEPGAAELEVVKYRDPGIALAIGGGVAAVGGVVLVALAFRDREGSGASDKPSIGAAPLLSPSTYGVAISGRF
ncbi:hypothetical protein [Enhygromyxa salina]|uniref:hypothetical protein n=1 Tax=Enhygromyxa salina TaxID=215803 RepID=UPI0011B22CE5|nr:hypothetical protein [Enhygromyxa salina]